MPEYLSPGVYVEEVPSMNNPIAGVSTSTAGFIGTVPDSLFIPPNSNTPPVLGEVTGTWDGTHKKFPLKHYPVAIDAGSFKVRVGADAMNTTNVNATLENVVDDNGTPTGASANITGDIPLTIRNGDKVFADYVAFQTFKSPALVGQAVLCTNFTEYKNAFGGFTLDPHHRNLTQAVYGFFNNGGSRCYVARITVEAEIDKALAAFELVDEIAIVAAPGMIKDTMRSKVVSHCKNMGDRFAVLDGPATEDKLSNLTKIHPEGGVMPARTDYAAWYFPWVKVFDPAAQKYENNPTGIVRAPPSGHIAGIYARVDNERGVHKAPANVAVMGALDLTQRVSKAQQAGLNPIGVNCIRVLNNNILVWGARTVGGDENGDLKYINVRRTLLFLRKSIDEGTQWVVFEPNSPALWQAITRNVTAFLTEVWRSGALFGTTQPQAFYVKCDAETNPQSSIDQGKVVTEIGVAIVRPAEFVIFRISQMAGAGS